MDTQPQRPLRLRDRLVDRLVDALADFDAYRDTERDRLEARVGFLVDAFQDALVHADPGRFAHYLANLSIRRVGEGHFLDEMTLTLAVLEATTWEQVVERAQASPEPVDPATTIARLRDVTRTVGAARDQLARSYRAHARLSERELDRLVEVIREVAPSSGLRLRLSRLAPYFTMVCD